MKKIWIHTSPKEPLDLVDSEMENMVIISLVRHPLDWLHAMTRRGSHELRPIQGKKAKNQTEGYLKRELKVYTGEPGTKRQEWYRDPGAVYQHALECWAEHAYFNSLATYKPKPRGKWPISVLVKYEDLAQEPHEVFKNLRDVGVDLDLKNLKGNEYRKWWPLHLKAVEEISSSKEIGFATDCEWGKKYLLDNHAPLLEHLGYTL